MPVLKSRAEKCTPKKVKNQILLYLYRRKKTPLKSINTSKEEFCACTYFCGGPQYFYTGYQRPPGAKLWSDRFTDMCNQGTHTAEAQGVSGRRKRGILQDLEEGEISGLI